MNVTSAFSAGGLAARLRPLNPGEEARAPKAIEGELPKKEGTTRSTVSKDGPQANLSKDELAQVEKLKARDREVRAHEAAHMAAAGGLARGGANFSYQRGPDGQLYAIGGEVGIDISSVPGNPHAMLRKAEIIRRAALAPAQPSSQDRAVAAAASQMQAAAQAELRKQRISELQAGRYGEGERGRSSALSLSA